MRFSVADDVNSWYLVPPSFSPEIRVHLLVHIQLDNQLIYSGESQVDMVHVYHPGAAESLSSRDRSRNEVTS
jgi:hypothetical protein